MSYWGNQGWQQPDYGNCGGGGYGYGGGNYCGGGYGNTFVLIVVLFILLIIVGSVFYN